MIGKKIRIKCYRATYEVRVTAITGRAIYGNYKLLAYDNVARKYKSDWDTDYYGAFTFDATESIKVLN